MPVLPRLTAARCAPTREVEICDAEGERRHVHIPDERPLTLFVDKRELVTLMTLGQCPELLVLGYLLNQGLIAQVHEVSSVTVDWSVGAAAVHTHAGINDLEARTAKRVVTTGCGQGTVFGDLVEGIDRLALPPGPPLARETLFAAMEVMRGHPGIYKQAGSVHGTALFDRGGDGEDVGEAASMRFFVEDVGRHNAIDTVAGWMAMNGVRGDDKLLVTTGRLTSEMVLKAARLRLPIVVSRNGVTAMGHGLAARLGMTLVGRASGRRYLCYTGAERLTAATADTTFPSDET